MLYYIIHSFLFASFSFLAASTVFWVDYKKNEINLDFEKLVLPLL